MHLDNNAQTNVMLSEKRQNNVEFVTFCFKISDFVLIFPKMLAFITIYKYLALYYFHVNGRIGIVQKIDFEIRPNLGCTTSKTSRKVVLNNLSVRLSVCLSVRLSVCLAVAFPASSHRRKVQPIELKL